LFTKVLLYFLDSTTKSKKTVEEAALAPSNNSKENTDEDTEEDAGVLSSCYPGNAKTLLLSKKATKP